MKKIFHFPISLSSHYHRIKLPLSLLHDIEVVDDISAAEVVYFNRFPEMDLNAFFNLQRQHGFKYILDLDDMWHSPILPLKVFKGFQIEQFIKSAAHITVSTDQLYQKVRSLNSKVTIVPNALPFEQGQFVKKPLGISDNIHFIYTSSASNSPNIDLLAASFDLPAPVYVAGLVKGDADSMKMYNAFKYKSVFPLPQQDFDNYMSVYDVADCLIVPMYENAHNIAKSNLKTLEAGCKEIPIIASKTLPYYNPQDAAFIDYAAHAQDWYTWMKYYMDNPNYVKDKGAALGAHVRTHYDLKKINTIRTQIIHNL